MPNNMDLYAELFIPTKPLGDLSQIEVLKVKNVYVRKSSMVFIASKVRMNRSLIFSLSAESHPIVAVFSRESYLQNIIASFSKRLSNR
jgi:hypothetical protein